MKTSLTKTVMASYVNTLLDTYIPDGISASAAVEKVIAHALERVEHCFTHIHRKYYTSDGVTTFNHLHGDHMASFLWFISDELLTMGEELAAEKLGYVNKIMHGLDLYPYVRMPDIFLLSHPVGSVIGRADYANFLVVYQGVTVGSKNDLYPSLGEGTVLFSGTKIIGDVRSGSNVVFGANAFVSGTSIASDSLVVGTFPAHRILPHRGDVVSDIFGYRKWEFEAP